MSESALLTEKVITKNKYFPSEPINQIVNPPVQDTTRPLYRMHKYWARKPWYVVGTYLKHFTKEGELVLDPFSGSGVVGIEAIANNRKAVLVDLNPIATFITKNTARVDFELSALLKAYEEIRANCETEIRELYLLDEKCPSCNAYFEIRHLLRGPKFSEWIVYGACPACIERKQYIRRPLKKSELQKLKNIEKSEIKYWYPKGTFPEKFYKDRITYKGIKYIHQIFTRRNLYALSIICNRITKIKEEPIRDLLKLAFLNTLLHVSKLKAENVRPMAVNNYWVPDDWIEENVWFRFNERFNLLKKGKGITFKRISQSAYKNLKVHNASALNLSMLDDNSIEYIFTDPPYGDSIQYFELSMIWNAWLGNMPSNREEAVINPAQKKDVNDYGLLLNTAFSEMFRVLKYGRWISVCFHNKEFKVWNAILQACKKAGFVLVNALPQEPISQSFNQAWAKYSSKTDMIINLIKPFPGDKGDLFEKYSKNGKVKIKDVIEEVLNRKDSVNLKVTDLYDRVLMKIMRESFYSEHVPDKESFSVYKIDEILSQYNMEKFQSETR